MLLLSSATRIFGTTHPPAILHRARPSGCTSAKRVPCFHFIGAFAGVRVNHPAVGLCRKSILPNCTLFPDVPYTTLENHRVLVRAPLVQRLLMADGECYHGMIFFKPFFFLLLDSFLPSFLSVWAFSEGPPWAAAFGFVVSVDGPVAAAPPSSLAVASAAPSVLCAVSLPPAAAPSLAVGGVAGSGFWASGFASVPSAGGVTFSAPLGVPPVPPAATVATMDVPEPPIRGWLPPDRMSIPSSLLDSGLMVGAPVLAAVYNSAFGFVSTSLKGLPISD